MKLLRGELKSQLLWCTRTQWGLLIALAVLSSTVYLTGIRPANVELEQTHRQYAAARFELDQDQDRNRRLPQVEMDIQRLRARVERFDKKLPRQKELASFINDVTHVGQQAALRNFAWRLDSKPSKSDQLTELPIQFSFEGDFQSGVVEFLRGTQDMQRLIRVRKLDLKSSDALDGQVKAQLTLNIYFGEN